MVPSPRFSSRFLFRFLLIGILAAVIFAYMPLFAKDSVYWASLGLCVLAAVGVEHLLQSSLKNILSFYVILFALTVMLSAAIFMTVKESSAWRNSPSSSSIQLVYSKTARWIASSKLGHIYLKDPRMQSVLSRLSEDRALEARGILNSGYTKDQLQKDTNRVLSIVDLYQQVIDDKPDYAEPYFNLGQLYESLGDVPTATYFYEQACRRDHKQIMAYLRLGDMYRIQGRANDAAEIYIRAVMINPQNQETLSTVKKIYQHAIEAHDHPEIYIQAMGRLEFLKDAS